MKTAELSRQLEGIEREFEGTFYAKVVRLDTGEVFCLREREILPTASTCKLCILYELFRRAGKGTVDLDAPITWRPEFHRGATVSCVRWSPASTSPSTIWPSS